MSDSSSNDDFYKCVNNIENKINDFIVYYNNKECYNEKNDETNNFKVNEECIDTDTNLSEIEIDFIRREEMKKQEYLLRKKRRKQQKEKEKELELERLKLLSIEKKRIEKEKRHKEFREKNNIHVLEDIKTLEDVKIGEIDHKGEKLNVFLDVHKKKYVVYKEKRVYMN